MIPFTYFIGWPHLNTFYYGVRYGKTCHPDSLWTTYFTSSKEVLKFRAEHGEPQLIEIRKIFSSKEKAREWEHKVLRRMRAPLREDFLNLTTAKAPSMLGKSHSPESRLKSSISNTGVRRSPESNARNSAAQMGKKLSAQARANIALGHTGLKFSDNHKANIAATKIGRKWWTKDGQSVCRRECPGEGWILGKVHKKRT